MRIKSCIPHLILTLLLTVTVFFAAAGDAGKIKGTVIDAKTGDPLAGVSVQIKGTTMGAKTDLDGKFLILSVPPGTYTLVFSSAGFETVEMTDVQVTAGKVTERDIKMKPGKSEIGKVVTVTGKRKGIDFNQTGTISVKPSGSIHEIRIPSADYQPSSDAISASRSKVHYNGGPQGYCREVQIPPVHGGSSIVNDEPFDAMFFKNYGVNPFVDTEDDHLSTFATDVDDASFIMARSYLNRGELPPVDAIRVEEFINHFDYRYPAPFEKTFAVNIEGAPSEFGQNCTLLRIGIKGLEIPDEMRKPANLVFVIDISGSMKRENRLRLVKRSLLMLLDELRRDDKVGIVVYGNHGREILQPTSIRYRQEIERAIKCLQPGGATNAEEGIVLGYQMARRNFEKGKINRVILCSDGVANVGRSGPDAILEQIKEYADFGITLSAIGFGMGNYNDILMEKLGNKGNGHYAYVDNLKEAHRVFVENLTGNLQVIARDVKIQVDFNPDVVRSYRLLGYENRDVADNKFRDDKEDGGEIGAGHTVTALYEIKFHKYKNHGPIGKVYIRYKDPVGFEVTEFSKRINRKMIRRHFAAASPEFQLAAVSAELAEILRKSYWAKESRLEDVYRIARRIKRNSEIFGIVELLRMILATQRLEDELAER
ncbi:MAG: von Willebrand factor type A domain-containing protein [candidate division Zixibacteria bacterium]